MWVKAVLGQTDPISLDSEAKPVCSKLQPRPNMWALGRGTTRLKANGQCVGRPAMTNSWQRIKPWKIEVKGNWGGTFRRKGKVSTTNKTNELPIKNFTSITLPFSDLGIRVCGLHQNGVGRRFLHNTNFSSINIVFDIFENDILIILWFKAHTNQHLHKK